MEHTLPVCRAAIIGQSALLLVWPVTLPALPAKTFQVNASVVAGCVITNNESDVMGLLDFGTQSATKNQAIDTSLVQNSAFTLSCTPGTTLNMAINGGSNYNTTRNLKHTGENQLVAYRLYSHPSYRAASEIFVNQSIALNYNNPNNITLPIYGRLQLNGSSRAGNYIDTLMVTLSW